MEKENLYYINSVYWYEFFNFNNSPKNWFEISLPGVPILSSI